MPLEFGDLPPRASGYGDRYKDEVAELKQRPGQWAKLRTAANNRAASSNASNIKRGKSSTFQPAKDFEATSRGDDVWVRYIGRK